MSDNSADDRRLRELAELAILDTTVDPLVEKVCRLASAIFAVPMAYVSLIDATHQHMIAGCGMDLCSTAREDAICNITIRDDSPLVIEDARADPRLENNHFVVGSPYVRFYAGIPLALTPGVRLGAFCIADTAPRHFGQDELASLRALADLVVGQLRHHANREELARRTLELADKQTSLIGSMAKLEWTASHDALTRLPNRTAITERLVAAVADADQRGHSVALLMLDIDHFKTINDTLGHDAGDAVLVAVAGRLAAAVGSRGVVARIGGDEFAVVLDVVDAEGIVSALATEILLHMREPVIVAGAAVDTRVTLGVAMHSGSATCTSDLFKEADIALYSAKEAGRDGFAFFHPSMREDLELRVKRLAVARAAVFAGRLEPYYQPKVCLVTNRVVGFEALLRWHHPTRGLCGPDAMGDVFADAELAVAIGRAMLYRAAADMVAWRQRHLAFGHVAINVAGPEFYTGDYAERILACLAMHGLTPDLLEIEVTETVFLGSRSDIVGKSLRKLADAGVSIALDDFGTGYASLTHLKRYPVGSIKIDRSFIADIETDADDATIVETVASLANSLKIGVVAEGIETPAQLAFLRARSCAIGQGYLFAKPMPASRVPYFLRGWEEANRSASAQSLDHELRAIEIA